MGFYAENELHHFNYDDCRIVNAYRQDKNICLEVEALIVTPQNSANEQLTSSYADITKIVFSDAELVGGVKDGLKKYDADDQLIEEIPDVILSKEEMEDLFSHLKESYLYGAAAVDDHSTEYVIGIDMADNTLESMLEAPSYQLRIKCSKVSCYWNRYLNRVQG